MHFVTSFTKNREKIFNAYEKSGGEYHGHLASGSSTDSEESGDEEVEPAGEEGESKADPDDVFWHVITSFLVYIWSHIWNSFTT